MAYPQSWTCINPPFVRPYSPTFQYQATSVTKQLLQQVGLWAGRMDHCRPLLLINYWYADFNVLNIFPLFSILYVFCLKRCIISYVIHISDRLSKLVNIAMKPTDPIRTNQIHQDEYRISRDEDVIQQTYETTGQHQIQPGIDNNNDDSGFFDDFDDDKSCEYAMCTMTSLTLNLTM